MVTVYAQSEEGNEAVEAAAQVINGNEAETITVTSPDDLTITVEDEQVETVTQEGAEVAPTPEPVSVPNTWLANNGLNIVVFGALGLALIGWIIKTKGRVGQSMKERVNELENVTFPTSTQAWHTMVVVLVMMLLSGLMLGFMDQVLSWFVFDVLR